MFLSLQGGTSKILDENIEVKVKAIGQNSRGCKTRMNSSRGDYYGFIRETSLVILLISYFVPYMLIGTSDISTLNLLSYISFLSLIFLFHLHQLQK